MVWFARLAILLMAACIGSARPHHAFLLPSEVLGDSLTGMNTTELLVFTTGQLVATPDLQLGLFQTIAANLRERLKLVPGLFAYQPGSNVSVTEEAKATPRRWTGQQQQPNFGAVVSWAEVMKTLQSRPPQSRKLFYLIRHGQAWENLNPLPNSVCEFPYGKLMIPNFDSELTPKGHAEALELNALLAACSSEPTTTASPSSSQGTCTNGTWFEELGMNGAQYFSSPLTRTLQTTIGVFEGKLNEGEQVTVSELLRGNVGTDVCNARRSVYPTPLLPPPFVTGCQADFYSLTDRYGSVPGIPFTFPVRPAGGQGIGLTAYEDQIWRSDVDEADISKVCRILTFIGQTFQFHPTAQIVVVVTHSEIISALYQAFNLTSPSTANCELFPFMIDAQ